MIKNIILLLVLNSIMIYNLYSGESNTRYRKCIAYITSYCEKENNRSISAKSTDTCLSYSAYYHTGFTFKVKKSNACK